MILREPDVTNKQTVIEAVRQLPDDASLEKISEEIAILAAIRRGDDAIEEGRVVTHEEVKEKFDSWVTR